MGFNILVLTNLLPIIFISSKTIGPNNDNGLFSVDEDNNQLSRVTETIINCCFNKKNFVFFADTNSTNKDILNVFSSVSTPLHLFDIYDENILEKRNKFKKVYVLNETHVNRLNLPMTDVAIMMTSDENLGSLLLRIKGSIWWNSGAQVLLINNAEDGCQKAYHFLRTLWSYNVIFSLYLCIKFSSGVSIYTYNPHSRTAPKSWNQVQVESLLSGWTMFEFMEEQLILEIVLNSQGSNFSLCSVLFNDNTKDLGNYNLKMVIFNDSKVNRYNEKKSGFERCESANMKIMCIMLEHIVATVTVKISDQFDFSDEHGEPQGPLKELLNNVIDIPAFLSFQQDSWATQLYPYFSIDIKIISSKFSRQTDDNFTLFLKSNFWIYFILCSFSCVLSTKYIFHISLLDSTLEFIRMFVSMSSLRQPRNLISRIFFMTVLMLIFVTSSLFQSHLNAVSTIPDPVSKIDSIGDLIESNLSFYGYANFKRMVPEGVLQQRFHTYNRQSDCIKRLLNGENIVCLVSGLTYPYYLTKNNMIHISQKNFLQRSASYLLPEDSPFLHKFNAILSRLAEGGFLKFYFEIEKLHHVKNLDETDLPSPINFGELKLIFAILFGGWILASFIFFCEICVIQLRKATKKV